MTAPKIVAIGAWGATPLLVTDEGEVLALIGRGAVGFIVERIALTDDKNQPIEAKRKSLAPGDTIEALYVQNGEQVWQTHKVEYVGVAHFQYREKDGSMRTCTQAYVDEGKHWRRT